MCGPYGWECGKTGVLRLLTRRMMLIVVIAPIVLLLQREYEPRVEIYDYFHSRLASYSTYYLRTTSDDSSFTLTDVYVLLVVDSFGKKRNVQSFRHESE